jgi:tetratricopeptide (TPR) repeat protein
MARSATFVCAAALLLLSLPVSADPAADALLARAATEFYNLDREAAVNTYREAIAADPENAAAYRGLATSLWLSITFRRGNMTVDDYLGGVTKSNSGATKFPPPPAETVSAFNSALDRALSLARKRLQANPNDVDAEYQLGAAVGLRASYLASVDGSMLGAFRAAREAYDAHERVLKLKPERHDASLIVGTYRYLVAALSLPLRVVAYMAGFGGGKEKGIELVESAAAYPGDNRVDARVALVLLYNRERRYDDALRVLGELRSEFPRNRLFWLETGSTSLRAGKFADADRVLTDGIDHLQADPRPRMFGEDALWYYKRGAARAQLGRAMEAQDDLTKSIAAEGRKWVHGRAHLELGRLAVKAGNRAGATADLQNAIALCDSDSDPFAADEARKLLASK